MKDIKSYDAEKYSKDEQYVKIEEGIYRYEEDDEVLYVSSLSFLQEIAYGEGESADDISQYPLEDILDRFYCHISDFYEDLNLAGSQKCYLEFASPEIEDIRKLRGIIGKHVYNKGSEEVELVIE